MDGTPEEVFREPEKLREIGLDIPKATELGMLLGLGGSIYTHEQLVAALKKAKGVD